MPLSFSNPLAVNRTLAHCKAPPAQKSRLKGLKTQQAHRGCGAGAGDEDDEDDDDDGGGDFE